MKAASCALLEKTAFTLSRDAQEFVNVQQMAVLLVLEQFLFGFRLFSSLQEGGAQFRLQAIKVSGGNFLCQGRRQAAGGGRRFRFSFRQALRRADGRREQGSAEKKM